MWMQKAAPVILMAFCLIGPGDPVFSVPLPNYDTLVSSRSTSVRVDEGLEEVSWLVSSDVVSLDDPERSWSHRNETHH